MNPELMHNISHTFSVLEARFSEEVSQTLRRAFLNMIEESLDGNTETLLSLSLDEEIEVTHFLMEKGFVVEEYMSSGFGQRATYSVSW